MFQKVCSRKVSKLWGKAPPHILCKDAYVSQDVMLCTTTANISVHQVHSCDCIPSAAPSFPWPQQGHTGRVLTLCTVLMAS